LQGVTVYGLPADFLLPIRLEVGGTPWLNSDQHLSSDGIWWLSITAQGVEQITLSPAPSAGLSLMLEYVYRPAPLAGPADIPVAFPAEFHPALLSYAAMVAYQGMEDNADFAQVHSDAFDRQVAELAKTRIMRDSGEGPFQFLIRA
jgi:hypothetical protein